MNMNKKQEYTPVKTVSGYTRNIPTSYNKPNGKRKCISVTIPESLVKELDQVSVDLGINNRSVVIEQLLRSAIDASQAKREV